MTTNAYFKVRFDIDGDTFEEDARSEIAATLRRIADRVVAGEDIELNRTVLDLNGNDIGRFIAVDEDYR